MSTLRIALLAALAALALAACGPRGPGPATTPTDPIGAPVTQTLSEDGLQDTVDALIDSWGIPHIYARNDHDVFFIQGYLAAADRFGQMDFARRLAQGRVSEFLGQLPLVGPLAAMMISGDTDLLFRTIFMGRDGRPILDQMEARLTARSVTVLQAYADGVNAWYYDMLTKRNGQTPPPSFSGLFDVDLPLVPLWTVRDTLSVLLLSEWAAANPVDEELAMGQAVAALDPRQIADFFRLKPIDPTTVLPAAGETSAPGQPDLAKIAAALKPAANAIKYARNALADGLNNLADPGRRSDNWAVDGEHAAGGAALLATDQEGGLLNPPFWRLSHLDSVTLGSGSVRVAGLSAPAVPGVQLGHNASVGWTASNAGYDVCDAYVETLASGESNAIMYKNQVVPLIEVPVSINMEMAGKWPPEKSTVLVSPIHGPILPGSCRNGYCIALAWTGEDAGDEVNALIDLLVVDDVSSGLDALRTYRHGAVNWILADAAGHIGYTASVAIPVREDWRSWPPYLPLAGASGHDWIGELPNGQNIRLENPAAGYLAAANNDIFGVLRNNDPTAAANYYYGNADLGYRAGRLAAALKNATTDGGATVDDFETMQLDSASESARTLLPYLFDAAAERPDLVDADMAEAIVLLSAWDFTTPAAVPNRYQPHVPDHQEVDRAVATALYHYWFGFTVSSVFGKAFSGAKLKLPGDGAADGPQFETKALAQLLEHPKQAAWPNWWSNGAKNDMLLGALRQALNYLNSTLGNGMRGWVWGRVHQAKYNVSINSIGLPDFFLPQLGPVAADGGDFAVNIGNTASLTGKMTAALGVAARLTMEIDGVADASWAALPGGQSERTSSPHFADLMPDFAAGNYVPLYFRLKEIAPATAARLQFVPR